MEGSDCRCLLVDAEASTVGRVAPIVGGPRRRLYARRTRHSTEDWSHKVRVLLTASRFRWIAIDLVCFLGVLIMPVSARHRSYSTEEELCFQRIPLFPGLVKYLLCTRTVHHLLSSVQFHFELETFLFNRSFPLQFFSSLVGGFYDLWPSEGLFGPTQRSSHWHLHRSHSSSRRLISALLTSASVGDQTSWLQSGMHYFGLRPFVRLACGALKTFSHFLSVLLFWFP